MAAEEQGLLQAPSAFDEDPENGPAPATQVEAVERRQMGRVARGATLALLGLGLVLLGAAVAVGHQAVRGQVTADTSKTTGLMYPFKNRSATTTPRPAGSSAGMGLFPVPSPSPGAPSPAPGPVPAPAPAAGGNQSAPSAPAPSKSPASPCATVAPVAKPSAAPATPKSTKPPTAAPTALPTLPPAPTAAPAPTGPTTVGPTTPLVTTTCPPIDPCGSFKGNLTFYSDQADLFVNNLKLVSPAFEKGIGQALGITKCDVELKLMSLTGATGNATGNNVTAGGRRLLAGNFIVVYIVRRLAMIDASADIAAILEAKMVMIHAIINSMLAQLSFQASTTLKVGDTTAKFVFTTAGPGAPEVTTTGAATTSSSVPGFPGRVGHTIATTSKVPMPEPEPEPEAELPAPALR